MLKSSKSIKIFFAFLSILGWFGLICQFYIFIAGKRASFPELLVRYFSYFTILTNLLVAVTCTTLAVKPNSPWGKFFSRSTALTAITIYILFVGVIYNLILRNHWKPEGLQLIVDVLLHSVIPVLFLLFWLVIVPKAALNWKNAFPWIIYPATYFLLILLRGSLSGFYPYPFTDVTLLGYHKVLVNGALLVLSFLFVSFLFIGIRKIIPGK